VLRSLLQKSSKFFFGKSGNMFGFQVLEERGENEFIIIHQKLPKNFRIKKTSPYQYADPFLFQDKQNNIWCFYEEKCEQTLGILKCFNLSQPTKEYVLDLDLDIHLSFPYVFEYQGIIYMIPETSQNNEVCLYESIDFPVKWKKVSQLLSGPYVDSHVFRYRNDYFLFSTLKLEEQEKYRLELYFSDSLFGPFQLHPNSPIQTGREMGRSGGSIFEDENNSYRVSQDCSEQYGREIIVSEILQISDNNYFEEIKSRKLIAEKFGHLYGGHHISMLNSENSKLWAVDLNLKESYFQRFIRKFQIAI
jgi:beta-xylosidase